MAALTPSYHRLSWPLTVLPERESDPRVSNTADIANYLTRLHSYVHESIEGLRLSQRIALDTDFALLQVQLDKLRKLVVGWDGYDAEVPTVQAIAEGRLLLKRLQTELVRPRWISASADGGVAFLFEAPGERRAQIEMLNNGSKFVHLYDLSGNSHTEGWPDDIDQEPFDKLMEPVIHYLQR